ncbi:MAG: cytochrome b/b6 domain-containing protein [Acetobacteraceae bacterium]|nr:cytochrome b/b6 domain-containing protein [Pseudomonadota bacterium]
MDDEVRPAGGYTGKQRRLHWIVAGLVVVQLALGSVIASSQPGDHKGTLLLHAGIGTAIFLLMLSRWQLRKRVGAPPPPSGTPVDAAALARANHLGYYALLLAMPVIGWCAYLFGGGFGAVHAAGAGILLLAIAAHLAGVAYHSWIRQDGLLHRMLPGHAQANPATEEG